MHIDESIIDKISVKLIWECVSDTFDMLDSKDDTDHIRIAVLGEISGICNMTEALKKALKE